MYIAYVHPQGTLSDAPELCLIPDKPDQFSFPVRVATLRETDVALYRLGPQESAVITRDPKDDGIVLYAFKPAKIFITPDHPQFPGISVKKLKLVANGSGTFKVFFQQDKVGDDSWIEYNPVKEQR